MDSCDYMKRRDHKAEIRFARFLKLVKINVAYIFLRVGILAYIYILGVFTEGPYSKPLERYVVYIPITTSSHDTSMTSN